MEGFALGPRSDVEEKCVALYASYYKIPCRKFVKPSEVPPNWIPVGTVDWFLNSTNWNVEADNYPEFLSSWLKRKVWKTNDWPLGQKVFIKPSDKLKRFNGRVTDGSYKGKKKGPYYCSDIVHFTNEWRYYISHGKVVSACWYAGQDEDKPAPVLDVVYLDWWVGSADFGETSDRGICLVEAHEPFSVGAYMGLKDFKIYGQWIVEGYEYLENKYSTHCTHCIHEFDCPIGYNTDVRRCKTFKGVVNG